MSTASNRVILLEDILQRLISILDESDLEIYVDEILMDQFREVMKDARKALADTEPY